MKNTLLLACIIAAFPAFNSPVDAATRKHEIDFDTMVPRVGDVVHLLGPFRTTVTFSGKSLTDVKAGVQRIMGTSGNTRHTYAVDFQSLKVLPCFSDIGVSILVNMTAEAMVLR